MNNEQELLTTTEIATYCRVSSATVRAWLTLERLQGVKLGNRSGWRVRREDLMRFLGERSE